MAEFQEKDANWIDITHQKAYMIIFPFCLCECTTYWLADRCVGFKDILLRFDLYHQMCHPYYPIHIQGPKVSSSCSFGSFLEFKKGAFAYTDPSVDAPSRPNFALHFWQSRSSDLSSWPYYPQSVRDRHKSTPDKSVCVHLHRKRIQVPKYSIISDDNRVQQFSLRSPSILAWPLY